MKVVRLKFFKKKTKSPQEILEGCRRGDPDCQEVLFKRYAASIMTVCRRYEHPSFGASDILQETFILVFENIKQFDPNKGDIQNWIKKIAVNTALKVIRKRKIQYLEFDALSYQIPDTTEDNIDIELFSGEQLLKKIKELPEGYRTIFNLFLVEGYTHKEISSILNISVETSKSQLSKAKKMMRKKLSDIKSSSGKRSIGNY